MAHRYNKTLPCTCKTTLVTHNTLSFPNGMKNLTKTKAFPNGIKFDQDKSFQTKTKVLKPTLSCLDHIHSCERERERERERIERTDFISSLFKQPRERELESLPPPFHFLAKTELREKSVSCTNHLAEKNRE